MSVASTWRDEAACIGNFTDFWYPPKGASTDTEVAVRVCQGCPVREACLEDALAEETLAPDTDGVYGIRGGLTAYQRRRIVAARTGTLWA